MTFPITSSTDREEKECSEMFVQIQLLLTGREEREGICVPGVIWGCVYNQALKSTTQWSNSRQMALGALN
jgi:hypothetical protein